MKQVWRVLHPTGTVWINLGDSWVRNPKKGIKFEAGASTYMQNRQADEENIGAPVPRGLKPKDLYGIPARIPLALQADGWYWRSKPPWIKRNPMPSSAGDRPNTAHEDILLFSKAETYFYDRFSVLRPSTQSTRERERRAIGINKFTEGPPGQVSHSIQQPRPNINKFAFGRRKKNEIVHPEQQYSQHRSNRTEEYGKLIRNWRTADPFFDSLEEFAEELRKYLRHIETFLKDGGLLVDEAGEPLAFQVNPTGYHGNHYAVWPRALVRDMLLASTSRHGACSNCGNQWKRIVEKGEPKNRSDNPNPVIPYSADSEMKHGSGASTLHKTVEIMTIGWKPTCDCRQICDHLSSFDINNEQEHGDMPCSQPYPVVRPIVLDCFVGTGTTLIEARALNLDGIGIDINFQNLLVDCRQRLDLDLLEAFENGSGVVARSSGDSIVKPPPDQMVLFEE
jgi:DNA modification methylase